MPLERWQFTGLKPKTYRVNHRRRARSFYIANCESVEKAGRKSGLDGKIFEDSCAGFFLVVLDKRKPPHGQGLSLLETQGRATSVFLCAFAPFATLRLRGRPPKHPLPTIFGRMGTGRLP
jgi:hypothetical protein